MIALQDRLLKLEVDINRNFSKVLCQQLPVMLLWSMLASGQDSVATIIQRSVEANNRDWEAASHFDYSERDEEQGGSKTYAVTMLFGTPYRRLIAVNGRKLDSAQEAEEQKKYEQVVAERRNESPDKKSVRIAKYEAERKRDRTMLEQLTAAFDFRLIGEQKLKGRRVYALKATPREGYRPPDRDSQVLTGMEGRLWIDRDTYQWVKVEAHVTHPVRIEGFLAEVEPGTQFELEKTPVTPDIWLASHFSMRSNAKVLLLFHHHTQEDDTFFNYHEGNATPFGSTVQRRKSALARPQPAEQFQSEKERLSLARNRKQVLWLCSQSRL
jgi:hypothetical protein